MRLEGFLSSTSTTQRNILFNKYILVDDSESRTTKMSIGLLNRFLSHFTDSISNFCFASALKIISPDIEKEKFLIFTNNCFFLEYSLYVRYSVSDSLSNSVIVL